MPHGAGQVWPGHALKQGAGPSGPRTPEPGLGRMNRRGNDAVRAQIGQEGGMPKGYIPLDRAG